MTRIVSDTDTALTIESRPWGLGLFLSAIVLAGVFAIFLGWNTVNWVVTASGLGLAGGAWWWFQRDIRLVRLHLKPDGTATLTTRGLRSETRRDFAPGTLRAAVHTERSGDGDTYRLMLLIDGADGSVERLPFTHTFSSWGEHDAVAKRIMAWRDSTA